MRWRVGMWMRRPAERLLDLDQHSTHWMQTFSLFTHSCHRFPCHAKAGAADDRTLGSEWRHCHDASQLTNGVRHLYKATDEVAERDSWSINCITSNMLPSSLRCELSRSVRFDISLRDDGNCLRVVAMTVNCLVKQAGLVELAIAVQTSS